MSVSDHFQRILAAYDSAGDGPLQGGSSVGHAHAPSAPHHLSTPNAAVAAAAVSAAVDAAAANAEKAVGASKRNAGPKRSPRLMLLVALVLLAVIGGVVMWRRSSGRSGGGGGPKKLDELLKHGRPIPSPSLRPPSGLGSPLDSERDPATRRFIDDQRALYASQGVDPAMADMYISASLAKRHQPTKDVPIGVDPRGDPWPSEVSDVIDLPSDDFVPTTSPRAGSDAPPTKKKKKSKSSSASDVTDDKIRDDSDAVKRYAAKREAATAEAAARAKRHGGGRTSARVADDDMDLDL